MQPERDLQITVASAGCGQSEMIENTLAEALSVGEPVGRGKVDPGLP
jgi:hypothetical protein